MSVWCLGVLNTNLWENVWIHLEHLVHLFYLLLMNSVCKHRRRDLFITILGSVSLHYLHGILSLLGVRTGMRPDPMGFIMDFQ
uniref:Uncharacterized protein n=1 Tax=Pyxicephalus adspersus TaxID=30357 RepID=A0AAV3AS38_PYXAD|nr:TPA: hypothetical protein GDO54_006027 [Pyxicephalus adspersus]